MFTESERKWWHPVSHFAGHVFVGAVLFCVLAAPAVGLGFLVRWLASQDVPQFTIQVLTFVERAIVVTDAGLFLVYLVVGCINVLREM